MTFACQKEPAVGETGFAFAGAPLKPRLALRADVAGALGRLICDIVDGGNQDLVGKIEGRGLGASIRMPGPVVDGCQVESRQSKDVKPISAFELLDCHFRRRVLHEPHPQVLGFLGRGVFQHPVLLPRPDWVSRRTLLRPRFLAGYRVPAFRRRPVYPV